MKKVIQPEYYCDICGKQVRTHHDLFTVSIDNIGIIDCIYPYYQYDACRECRKKIVDFIKDIMKDAKKEEDE